MQSHIRIGSCAVDTGSCWSNETVIINPAEFHAAVCTSLDQSGQSGYVRPCSVVSEQTSTSDPSSTESSTCSDVSQICLFPTSLNEPYHVTVIMPNRILCLVIRLLDHRCGHIDVPFFVLSIESRVHVLTHSSLPLMLKCLVVPIPLSSGNSVTPVSFPFRFTLYFSYLLTDFRKTVF